jgi:hypothetical protein
MPGARMRFILTLFLTIMVLAETAQAQKVCTEMWCREGFALELAGASWKPGKYVFTINADDAVVTCTATLPLRADCAASAHCSHADWSIGESGCALPPEAQGFHEISSTVIPKHVRVDITGPDTKTARVELPVIAQCGYPNGKDCDSKQCCGATARMDVVWR